nr:disease resistance protein RPV1-like [Ziziphus jujuba var. spinosa]
MATKTFSSSSSSSRKYDVFLSFRGDDTRLSFTDHLYKSLSDKGIYTFRDDKKLEKGKDVAPELLKAIEESRFAIVIFSKDYASSTWCLVELANIVECKKELGLIVLPVFYHVEVEDVKERTWEFGKAFAKHYKTDLEDDMRKVKEWREALTEVASSIEGWHIKERRETGVIEEIVKVIEKELNLTFSTSNNGLVGMDSRIMKMQSLLNINQLEIALTVLIILDDVDEWEQIEDLVGNAEEQHRWLGPGSRVIVTTKDKDLLKTYGENNIYKVNPTHDEALQLFSRRAFKRKYPFDDFVKLSHDFVEYANHHPLALKVLGSFLFGRNVDQWSDTLVKLKRNPDRKVTRVLQASYDDLDDDQKKIFLDIFGQYIVYREFPEEPGKYSRIWHHEDARNVLMNNTVRNLIEVLSIELDFPECVGHLSNELRLLEWHGYPHKSIPSSFCPRKLVELNMSSSGIERLWKETIVRIYAFSSFS